MDKKRIINFTFQNKTEAMLQNITATLLFIVLSLTAFGQNNTIEVKISESVEIPVSAYVYHVSNSDINSSSPFDFDFDLEDDEFEDVEEVFSMPKTISSMLEDLKGAKFNCITKSKGTYDVDPDDDLEDADKFDREIIVVRVNSIEELNRLSKFVLQMDDAYGELANVEFEDISNSYGTIFPKMMQSAKDKAKILASAAGRKVGEVLQVSEGNGGLNLYGEEMGEYMEAMMEMSSKLWKKEIPVSKFTKLTMRYVFELK